MKKNPLMEIKAQVFVPKRSLWIVGLCTALFVGETATLSASPSDIQKITLQVSNVTLKEAIEAIKKQSDYLFFIDTKEIDLNNQISINLHNKSVEEILSAISKKQGVHYLIEGNRITLTSAPSQRSSVKSVDETKQISGTIKDATGFGVPGATIMVKGKHLGTTTDLDGRYTLNVPENATIVISYIGYEAQELKVGNKTIINILLKENSELLSELVVTALGIKREEKALGYSVQKIKGDELTSVKAIDVATSLTGKIAGLNIKNSSEFNESPSISLRGESPLLVVDGVPFGNMSLSDIAADDIASIDVLKGATASALYGARGGSGAIMVSTKRGQIDGLSVQVNSSTMFNAGYLVLPEVQHGYSTGQSGKYTATDYVWGDKMDIGRTAVQYDPYTYEWKEMPLVSKGKDNFKNFLETGFITNNNVSVTQKGKYGSFRTSLSHVYNKGQYPNQRLNKITYSLAGDMKWKGFTFEGGATYNKRFYPNNQGSGYGGGGYIYNLLVWTGTDYDVRDYKNYWRKEDQEQNWMNDVWYDNPYYLAEEVTQSNDYDKVNTFLSAKYDIQPWLTFSLRSGADAYMSRTKTKNAVNARGGWHKNGYFGVSRSTGFSINNDALLMANHKSGDFAFDGFVGGTLYYYFDDGLSSNTRNGLSIPGYYSLKASVDPASTSSSYKSKQVNSVYGKASASWKSTIFVDVTGRNDWSSTLPKETRSYFYPSVSSSVVLSQFVPMPQWVNFWKVRGSWTVTKNDLSVYDTNKAYSIGTNVWDGLNTASYPTSMRSSTLEPTSSRSYEVGTVFNLLDNRLRVDVAYYNKLKYNLTRNATISAASGYTSTLINYDEEQMRKGLEVTLSGEIIKNKNFEWSSTFNWSLDRYYYAQVDDVYSTQKPWVAAGERWDWYGIYDWERDPQGNIIHENGYPIQSQYQSVMGHEYPDWIWGLSNTFRYKDFTLNISMDGRVGGMAFSRTDQAMWNSGVHPDSDNEWRYDEVVNGKKSYIGNGVKVVSGSVAYDTYGNITEDSRVFAPNDKSVSYESYTRTYHPWSGGTVYQNVHKATFFKIRDLSLSYNLPKSVCNAVKLKGASVSVVAQNLLIWMKEFEYADPDVDSDDLNSPSMRYVGFNVKMDF